MSPDEEPEIPNLEAMVATAITNMLPGLNANEVISRLVSDIRNGAGSSGGSGGGGRPTTINGWLEKFRDALNWWRSHRLAQGENNNPAIYTWAEFRETFCKSENSGEYMRRFVRLASFVGPIVGDARRQAKHFKWGLKKWVLDRLLNTEFADVSAVNDAARNIEIFHEGSGYKRSRDGDRIQHRAQGDDSKGYSGKGYSGRGYDSRGQMDRGRSDQVTEYRGRSDRATDQRSQVDRSRDYRSTARTGNDRQGNGNGNGNGNNRQWKDQSARGTQPNRSSGSSSQHRPTETLPPPPLCPTCGKPHPGECRKISGACFRCGSTNHKVKDCPMGNFTPSANTPRLPAPSGRVFTTTRDQAAGTSDHLRHEGSNLNFPWLSRFPCFY
ncbi:zinc finger, CCHC-type, Retrotransposon gag domain protein [Artemisia annua]|uniref:Zinc finger, CCHC-type, Retrotransposon gag domain protein n=1 Tax=Artemisia annua TaxID=35608 RepID=A0A2U1LPZ6_ARTAN|nr:zinc finger, CCHC-type, Retrotransposon gag domain protein [Artemisia annua]